MTTAAKKTTHSNVATNDSDTPITSKVNETLHQTVNSLTGHACVAENKLRQSATTSAEIMTEKQRQVKNYWDDSAVGKYAKENPVATAGIAFAAGILLTKFLKKSS
jgi:hypothetical protein